MQRICHWLLYGGIGLGSSPNPSSSRPPTPNPRPPTPRLAQPVDGRAAGAEDRVHEAGELGQGGRAVLPGTGILAPLRTGFDRADEHVAQPVLAQDRLGAGGIERRVELVLRGLADAELGGNRRLAAAGIGEIVASSFG